jgi:hypothetical protein
MKNHTFKNWIALKEAFLPPPAPPPAMVQKAPEDDVLRAWKGWPALKKTDFLQKFNDKIQNTLKGLNRLAQATHDNPAIWSQLHAEEPNLAGLRQQEALEAFIDEYQRIIHGINSNPQKFNDEYRKLTSKSKDDLTLEELDKLMAYSTLFSLTTRLNINNIGLQNASDEDMIQTLKSLDNFIYKSPTGYQKSLIYLQPLLK